MVAEDKYIALGRRLTELHAAFGAPSEDFLEMWEDNFSNANTEVLNVIVKSDSELQLGLLCGAYRLSKKTPHDGLPFARLYRLSFDERDEKVTPYGLMLVKVRFCLGFLGNMKAGDLVTPEECQALIFAYEAYWNFGDDYLLGSVVETQLRRIPASGEWQSPEDAIFARKDKLRQLQNLGYAIGDGLKELADYHRMSQPGLANFLFAVPPKKPEFKDFRKILGQIHEAARAERFAKTGGGRGAKK